MQGMLRDHGQGLFVLAAGTGRLLQHLLPNCDSSVKSAGHCGGPRRG